MLSQGGITSLRLELVAAKGVLPHEDTSPDHVVEIARTIQEGQIVLHPIQSLEVDGKLVVLDGHHRLAALRSLGIKYVPVQIIPREHVTLSYWFHVMSSENWVLEKSTPSERWTTSDGGAYCSTYRQREGIKILPLRGNFVLSARSIFLSYKDMGYVRSHQMYGESPWVRYNGITIQHVIEAALCGYTLPPGITRFMTKYRVLNLNVPLSLLYHGPSSSWESLQQAAHKGRVYEEPIIYVEPQLTAGTKD